MAVSYKTPFQIDSAVTLGVAKCRVDVTDLAGEDAAAAALNFNALATGFGESKVPPNSRIMYAWVKILTPFSGGGAASCAVKVGDAGNDDELVASASVFTGASGIIPGIVFGTFEATYNPIVTITVSGEGIVAEDLTAGAIEVLIQYEALNTAESFTS